MQLDRPDYFKFIPPTTPFGFVDRPGILDSWLQSLSARLVIVHGPPGYGKTALLSSLAAQWGSLSTPPGPLAWYSLGPSDDDAAVFVEGIVRAIRRVVPQIGKNTLATLHEVSDARPTMGRLMAVLAQELRDVNQDVIYLVLDDFHFITDKAILETIEQLLKDDQSSVRWIVTTEAEPPFYLSTLRSQGVLAEIGEEELKLTADEVAALVDARVPGGVEQRAVESIVREVRGWPSAAAVAAAIVTYTGRPLPFTRLAPTEHGYSQLVREVLGGVPSVIRQGLARASLLEVLEPSALRVVLGGSGPEVVLDAVEKLSLPAARIGEGGHAIRYDPVLRAALERELASTTPPQDLRVLYKEVASYYAAIGLRDQAVTGYLRGWAHEEAAALVEEAAPIEIASRHLDTVLRWLRAIPNVTRKGRPRLMVQEARALLARGQTPDARALLATVESQLREEEDQHGLGQRGAAWSALQFMEGRYHEAAKAAEESLSQLSADDHTERSGAYQLLARSKEMLGALPAAFAAALDGLLLAEQSGRQELVVGAMAQLSHLAELKGEYSTALSLGGRAVERSRALGTEDLTILMTGAVAVSVFQERAQVEEAIEVANRMLLAAEKLRDDVGELRARLALAMAEGTAGNTPVDEVADNLLGLAGKERSAQIDRIQILLWAAAALLRQGKRGEGLARVKKAQEIAVEIPHQPSVLAGRVLLATGESPGKDILRPLVEGRHLRSALADADSRHWLSAAHRIVAQGYVRLGVWWRAKRNLQRSLELASREGYVGMPLGLPSMADRLFIFAVRHNVEPKVAGSLLGVAPDLGLRMLGPLLHDKNPSIRQRAEVAAKGLESGQGLFPRPRLSWPGLGDGGEPADPVTLQVLGGIDAFAGEQLVEWPSGDARTVAAYLVVRRATSTTREDAWRDLWPSAPEAEANLRFQVATYQIRQSLGEGYPPLDPARERSGEYYWDGDRCFIDVEHFRTAMRALEEALPDEQPPVLSDPTVRLLEEAVSTYQGEFMAGLDADWCLEQREQLRGQLLRVTRLLIDHYMALRRWRDAIRNGLKSLKSDPLQEDVVRDLMLCYFRVGDRASVMHQYREVKRLVAKERGAWPSDETRQLRVRLLGH